MVADALKAELQAVKADIAGKDQQIRKLAEELEAAELEHGQCILHMKPSTHMCLPCGHFVICDNCVGDTDDGPKLCESVTHTINGVPTRKIFPISSKCVCPVGTCNQPVTQAVAVRNP